MTAREWLIVDTDRGIIRREPTRTGLVDWILWYSGGAVVSRTNPVPGSYEYQVGHRPSRAERDACEATTDRWWLLRRDVFERSGIDWMDRVPDLYPYPDRPHETDLDLDRDQLIAQVTGTWPTDDTD